MQCERDQNILMFWLLEFKMLRSSILILFAATLSSPAMPQTVSPNAATRHAPSAVALAKPCQTKLDQDLPEAAEKCFRTALRQFPASTPLHEGLAQSLEKQHRWDDAEGEFRKADGAEGHRRLSLFADRLALHGETDRAIRIYQS